MKPAFKGNIPDKAWENIGNDDAPEARLLAHIEINGMSLHLEAIEVEIDDDDYQVAVDPAWEDTFQAHYSAFGGDGAFTTTTINGRTYALFASPFCT